MINGLKTPGHAANMTGFVFVVCSFLLEPYCRIVETPSFTPSFFDDVNRIKHQCLPLFLQYWASPFVSLDATFYSERLSGQAAIFFTLTIVRSL
jgi:hypothetical protein